MRTWSALLVLAGLTLAVQQAAAASLRAPFGIGTGITAAASPAPACPPLAKPVLGIQGVTFYTDARNSMIDPARRAADQAAKKPLVDFQTLVLAQSEGYLRTKGGDTAAARCVIAQLGNWADAGALTGQFNFQGANDRQWAVTVLAVAYLSVRDAPGLDARRTASIQRWFAQLGKLVQQPYRNARRRNNLFYWAGVADIAAGTAAGDRDLLDWGLAAAREGVGAIQADGTLPLELARGARALSYHAFALTALEVADAFARANGLSLASDKEAALTRLEDLVVRSVLDRTVMTRLAGVNQEWHGRNNGTTAWMEPAYARRRDARIAAILKQDRPIVYPFLGDVTLLFGVPLP